MEDLRWPHFSFHALEMLMELGLWEGLRGPRAEHLLCLVSWDRGSQALPRLPVAPCDLCAVRLQNGQCAYWLEHRL